MDSWKPDVCLYHGGCDDGFGAALAVHMRWGDAVEYIPAGYSRPVDRVQLAGKHVLFVDFSLKQAEMRTLASGHPGGNAAASVVVLDHHKTAEAELFPWSIGGKSTPPSDLKKALGRVPELLAMNDMENVEPVVAFFDMHKSGARMAWEFCHPQYEVPNLIKWIEDRDLWRFALRETRAVSAALRSHPHDMSLWHGFLRDSSDLVRDGAALLRSHEKNVQAFIAHRCMEEIAGHRVPAVNVPYHYASDCADAILKAEPDAPFCAAWFKRADGRLQYSLRSRDDRLDVSEIAKKFGGGGHRNAAGFERAA